MFGKNPILKPEITDGSTLKVTAIFETFQGEGPFVGYPATFIRLSGCNLACNFCDTEFDSFEEKSVDEIVLQAQKFDKNLIVITGGEPLRQNIAPLCQKLVDLGFLVQIETNGTLFQDLPSAVKIVCSPKISGGKYHEIRGDLLPRINAFKFIISATNQNYQNFDQKITHGKPIYLQPMDEYNEDKNRDNQKLVLELAKKHNCRICLQIHKILDIE